MAAHPHGRIDWRAFMGWARAILAPDRAFMTLVLIYGAAIGLLSLATPISVQMLINSVANTALPAPLFTLAAVLLCLLLLWALLGALRTYVMEIFRRRFFARRRSPYRPFTLKTHSFRTTAAATCSIAFSR